MHPDLNRPHCVRLIAVALFPLVASAGAARADIFQWEYINPADPSQGKQQSATLAPRGAGVDAVPGADFSYRDLTKAYLIGANLVNVDGTAANLTDADLAQSNLTNAFFPFATLTDANFKGAEVRGASFYRLAGDLGGIALAQLYSTASYQAGDLSGIGFGYNVLSSGNFAGQNLTNASFIGATLTSANFQHANLANAFFPDALLIGADCRGALSLNHSDANPSNLILPGGHISGLNLQYFDALLVVRDYDGHPTPVPITIDEHLSMGPSVGTLRMVFDADAWDSTISFAPGIPVTLGGTLELAFAADVNPATQLGRTFDLFDWTGVTPTGAFAVSSPYAWDLSNLYTTGEVMLTAVSEPASIALAAAICVLVALRPRHAHMPLSTIRPNNSFAGENP